VDSFFLGEANRKIKRRGKSQIANHSAVLLSPTAAWRFLVPHSHFIPGKEWGYVCGLGPGSQCGGAAAARCRLFYRAYSSRTQLARVASTVWEITVAGQPGILPGLGQVCIDDRSSSRLQFRTAYRILGSVLVWRRDSCARPTPATTDSKACPWKPLQLH
jgi:hypothetical protein